MSTENGKPGDSAPEETNEAPGATQADPDTEATADHQEADGEQASAEETDERQALQAEVEKLREEVLRSQADMQNVRRRAERDVESAHKYALEKFVAELLPVVDNLERALENFDRDDSSQEQLIEGVELTLRGFLDTLKRFNVESVNPKGEAFDPDKHQAMSMVPSEEAPANTVIDVFQKGYLLNGRLVRPAMVVISKGKAE